MPDHPNPECRGFQLIIAARNRDDLTATEYAVYVTLCSHRFDFKPTVSQLARGSKVSLRSAHRALVRLKALGMVAPVSSGKGGRSQQQRYVPVVRETMPQSPSIPETLPLCPENSATESDSEEKSQKEDSGLRPAADAARAPDPIKIPVPPRQQLFSQPLIDRMAEKTGRSGDDVRKLFGMAARDLGPGQALEIAVEAIGATVPLEYFNAAYHTRRGNRKNLPAKPMESGIAECLANILDAEQRFGVQTGRA
jgi:hypothetical protein